MRGSAAASAVAVGLVFFVFSPVASAQIGWIGNTSTDFFDGTNWGGGAVPGIGDDVIFRDGSSPNDVVDLGANDAEFAFTTFNDAAGGMTVNGTGTITLNVPNGGTADNVLGMWSLGGERLTTINPNLTSNGSLQGNNGHDTVFNGAVDAYALRVFNDTNFIFNGDFTHSGYNFSGGQFFTGNFEGSSITFNAGLDLNKVAFGGDLGIRNGQTVIIGAGATLTTTTPVETVTGLGNVNLFNQSTFRLNGDNLLDEGTDLFSRGGGGTPVNTFDLNGFSTFVEMVATENDLATMVIDFGAPGGTNELEWRATWNTTGMYEVVNFEPGVDVLKLGQSTGSVWWVDATDPANAGNIEAIKSRITVNGFPYMPFDALETDPYWTLVDDQVSREIELFNVPVGTPGDFDGDGDVDVADALLGQRNGEDLTPAGVWDPNFGLGELPLSAASAVPEPASLALIAAGVLLAGRRQRR